MLCYDCFRSAEREEESGFSDVQKMDIKISEKAQEWYEKELGVGEGRGVRFLGKVYGNTAVHEGFSIAIDVAKPENTIAITTHNDIPYFIDAADEWFFNGYNLEVVFNEQTGEPEYLFHEISK